MKYFDQHVHNHYSADSDETFQNYIDKVLSLNLDALEFTNHIDLDKAHYCRWKADVDQELKEIETYRKQYPNLTFYQGVEVGYCEDHLDEIKNLINTHDFDVVNLSMHWWDDVDFYIYSDFQRKGIEQTFEMYYSMVIKMINEFDNFDVLAHIDYAFKTIKKVDRSISIAKYEPYLKEIFLTLVKKNKALEINTKCQEGIDDINHLQYLLKLYKSLGGKYLTLSSDAHKAKRLCDNFLKYLPIIQQCGFNELTLFIKRKPHLIPLSDIKF